ncbi:anti-repressor SinI family protein [Litchfieldia salsa]|uniref:Anti-repressor SinI n=1 Tax=Litchfieldia salsa TaxID=930152 RepID=A0A1H0W0K9_9BACI|nr:anti-repressor SinI family protein [Litchfieldia salsa]SDP84269.1 Anti-repressor SinI [Litchfieldia salsa]
MEKSSLLQSIDSNQTLDKEWAKLILEAKNNGLSIKEIRDFFNDKRFTLENQ